MGNAIGGVLLAVTGIFLVSLVVAGRWNATVAAVTGSAGSTSVGISPPAGTTDADTSGTATAVLADASSSGGVQSTLGSLENYGGLVAA